MVGRGARLFDGDPARQPLTLVSSAALGAGALHLAYQVVHEPAAG